MRINFFTIVALTSVFALYTLNSTAQNIGINATGAAPATSAGLDVDFTNKGVLIPRVALTNVITFAPVVGAAVTGLLVYSTTAPTGGLGVGYYYWDVAAAKWQGLFSAALPGDAWQTIGNAGTNAATNFLGTTDNVPLALRSNNVERMRITPLGEVIVGGTAPVLPNDLFIATSLPGFDWAVNGYSNFNGSGTYGQIVSGTSVFGGVQGEYDGTGFGAGVRGLFSTVLNGTSFNLGSSLVGVDGGSVSAGSYKFGVYGTGGISPRSGGVMGNDGNFRWGGLGYFSAASVDYSVYGFGTNFTTGGAGGRMAGPSNPLRDFDNSVGLGIYGGVMGGWIKGLEYGTVLSGKRYGAYVDGKTLTNDLYVVLNGNETNERTASYAATSLSVDINAKGTANLRNGEAEVKFDAKYAALISSEKPIIVAVTPMGETKGVYIVSVSKDGFKIKENGNGTSNTSFSWMAIAEKAGYENPQISAEILNTAFDVNMNGVMHNDYDAETTGTAIWWNGTDVKMGNPSEIEKIVTERKTNFAQKMPNLAKPQNKNSQNKK